MKDIKLLILCIAIILFNVVISNYMSLFGSFLSPMIVTITTTLVCYGTSHIRLFLVMLLSYLFISFNDLVLRFYSGGTHDYEGLAWMNLFYIIGLVPSGLILFSAIAKTKNESRFNKIVFIIMFILLNSIHFTLCKEIK